jgi:hypothetical protein
MSILKQLARTEFPHLPPGFALGLHCVGKIERVEPVDFCWRILVMVRVGGGGEREGVNFDD